VYDRFETLLATRKGPILEVVLNRPEARNAITFKMEDEITELLNLATDDEVRVVTLRGAGELFSAGHDLKGENISSFEVEGCVLDHSSVAEAAAVGVPSEDGEQEIKVFVVPREPFDLAALGNWLAERMPQFLTPRYLETVPSLPGHRRLDGCRSPACAAGQPARPSGTAPRNAGTFPESDST
jgi:AMP-binding enzyme/enoyl-CoA hydratase/isomerase-like protein